MCLMAIPLGLGAGCVDSALNNYVSIHYNATVMSFLHCFYGVGVMVSPYIMSVVINSAVGWRGGYRTASLIQALIGSILLLALPLWKKAHGEESIQAEKKMKVLPISQTLRIPGALMTCLLFLTFCAIEVICGGWSATYMVEAKHMPANLAARATMYFYLGMALGRFLSGVAAKKLTPWQIIFISMGILGVSQTTLLVSGNNVLTMAALLMTGLGVGPLYPNFNYMTPLHFGKDVSQSVMGMQMTFASIGTIAAPRPLRRAGTAARHGHFPGVFDDILRPDRRRHYRPAPHAPAGGTASAMSNEQLAMKSAPADFAATRLFRCAKSQVWECALRRFPKGDRKALWSLPQERNPCTTGKQCLKVPSRRNCPHCLSEHMHEQRHRAQHRQNIRNRFGEENRKHRVRNEQRQQIHQRNQQNQLAQARQK